MDFDSKEGEPPVEVLNPSKLYTYETRVYKSGLEVVNMDKPISFGRDKKGNPYVYDGNHRARKALENGLKLLGQQFGSNNLLDVKKNKDYRPISELVVMDE